MQEILEIPLQWHFEFMFHVQLCNQRFFVQTEVPQSRQDHKRNIMQLTISFCQKPQGHQSILVNKERELDKINTILNHS